MLDVEAVELDAAVTGESASGRWLEQVLYIVAADVDGEEFLAQVGADEAAGNDHADGHGADGVAVQISAGRRRHCRFLGRSSATTRSDVGF